MLPSFEIERFRTFSHLVIPRLGRVNLIVGRNGAGKTMLLEALRFYGSGGDPVVLGNLLYDCDELYPGQGTSGEGRSEPFLALESLFHGRKRVLGAESALRLRICENDPLELRVELVAFRGGPYDQPLEPEGPQKYEPLAAGAELNDTGVLPGIIVSKGGRRILSLPSRLMANLHNLAAYLVRVGRSPAFVGATRIDLQDMARQWDAIALKEGEERVRECLRIIAPVERITAIGDPRTPGRRMFAVRVKPDVEPVPLKSLGDGMVRILRIALALEAAASEGEIERVKPPFPESGDAESTRLLLIDELENGIHHAVLPDLWRFLIKVAKLRDLQIFAATHSWDCVEAFQYAASKEEDSNAVLIRLEKKGDTNRAVIFAGEELPIVTQHGIEVR